MKIGAYVHMYPPIHNAGAEYYLHSILKYLAGKHDCRVILGNYVNRLDYLRKAGYLNETNQVIRRFKCKVTKKSYRVGDAYKDSRHKYQIDNVKVSDELRLLKGVDIIITHLNNSPEAEAFALKRKIPLVHLIHNDKAPKLIKHANLVVFNSKWIADKFKNQFHSIVLHPPIFEQDYKVENGGKYITLINGTIAKGVRLFYALAKMHPKLQFLLIKGAYGYQVTARRSNIVIWEQQKDIRKVYRKTKVLLVPSTYESYGRVGVEAAISGIPVIANSTPGLLEALGPCGIFPDSYDAVSWSKALKETLADYKYCSEKASRVTKQLTPERDIDFFESKIRELICQ